MLAGKPIVGTRAAATAELIQDGVNGLLYEPGNPKDLAKKIKFLHDDPLQSQRMGENGRKWAHDFFTRERYANQLMVHLSAYASGHTGKTIVTPNE
jgi:glycosyltransferase involved in cell wall biosynthesis